MPVQVIKRFINEHDAALEKSVRLPEAGATAHTDVISLNVDKGRAVTADFEIHADAAALAAGKRAILTPEHSADGQTWAAAPFAGLVVTGGASGGSSAATFCQIAPEPETLRQYVRLAVEVDAEAGDVSAAFAWIALVPQPCRIV